MRALLAVTAPDPGPLTVGGGGESRQRVGRGQIESQPTPRPYSANMPKFRIFRAVPVVIHP